MKGDLFMKKLLSAILALTLVFGFAATASAKTESYITRVAQTVPDTVFTTANAPSLIIPHVTYAPTTQNTEFELTLSGAEWLSEGSTSPKTGLTQNIITSTTMVVTVEPSYNFNSTNIDIPMLVKIVSGGDISVTVNGLSSVVSSGTYVFAQSNNGPMTMSTTGRPTFNVLTELGDIQISDGSESGRQAGEKIYLTLSEGFEFFEKPESIKVSGKYYSENISFAIDSNDRSKATILIKEDTHAKTGAIVLSGIQITHKKNAAYGNVQLKMDFRTYTQTNTVARYVEYSETIAPVKITEIESNNGRPIFRGTATKGELVAVFIGNKEIDYTTVADDGTWEIGFGTGKTALLEGSYTAEAGYYRISTEQISSTIRLDFEIKYVQYVDESWKKRKLKFTIGEGYYYSEGTKYVLEDKAFIDENSRTMLPLRVVSRAFGINDENIDWEEETRTVSLINNAGKQILIKINEKSLSVDGRIIETDASAVIVDGRTYLPLRAIATALGIDSSAITWNDETKTVSIN